ncbi:hypothetical protein Barb7_02781 [Bacteroidales bacterium Barb7]|nr:hypothetical protein Barb7_02781 [Bacteroidales bacterium Barb7]
MAFAGKTVAVKLNIPSSLMYTTLGRRLTPVTGTYSAGDFAWRLNGRQKIKRQKNAAGAFLVKRFIIQCVDLLYIRLQSGCK